MSEYSHPLSGYRDPTPEEQFQQELLLELQLIKSELEKNNRILAGIQQTASNINFVIFIVVIFAAWHNWLEIKEFFSSAWHLIK